MKPKSDGVAVLFVRRDSHYKDLGADAYDADRDARSFSGGKPVVAHPPCRAFGRLRHLAQPAPGEKELAYWAIAQVRRWGGVLEHPQASLLWREMNLPMPGKGRDEFGGFSISVLQKWWGHRADKATWLYVCGCDPKDVPQMPLNLHESPCVVTSSLYRRGHPRWRPHLLKEEREHTPVEFARWLLLLASRAGDKKRNEHCNEVPS